MNETANAINLLSEINWTRVWRAVLGLCSVKHVTGYRRIYGDLSEREKTLIKAGMVVAIWGSYWFLGMVR